MTSSELRKLIESGENQYLEFKKKADHPDKIVREMVAFANSGGGVLLLGVEDNGRISGLKYPEEDLYVMEAAILRYARPALRYETEMIPVGEGKFVLKYSIPDGGEKPYYWLSDRINQKFAVYVRSRDQSLRASYEMFRFLCHKEQVRAVAFGESEILLLEQLGKTHEISIREFSRISGLGKKKVSALFVSLCCSGVMEIIPGESFDMYRLRPAYRT
jgi:hypothetical protein